METEDLQIDGGYKDVLHKYTLRAIVSFMNLHQENQ